MVMFPKIEVKELRVSYGEKLVLKGITLTIPRNEITAIIGPSGCGKSTLIKALNRMVELVPEAKVGGQVFLDGEDIYAPDVDAVTIRRRIGMVFQKPNPFPSSIYHNVAFGPRILGVNDRAKLDNVVQESLVRANLWDETKDRLRENALSLSGGQQQRLCIARALATNPEVLLLDEPASALDPISTAKVEDLLRDLKREVTIVLVTHNMQQAIRVSDRTGFMLLGELVEFKPTSELFDHPSDSRTEAYITGKFG